MNGTQSSQPTRLSQSIPDSYLIKIISHHVNLGGAIPSANAKETPGMTIQLLNPHVLGYHGASLRRAQVQT